MRLMLVLEGMKLPHNRALSAKKQVESVNLRESLICLPSVIML